MFCVLCRRLFWRDPKPAGRLSCRGPRGQAFGPWGGKPKQSTRSPQGGG
jgi:hypothetical protein